MNGEIGIDGDAAAIGGLPGAVEQCREEVGFVVGQHLAERAPGCHPEGGTVDEDWDGVFRHVVNIRSQGAPRQRHAACGLGAVGVFVQPNMSPTPVELLLAVSEPTRIRILNCLAAAPLFVSDLQVILELPQSTVSRHLGVLRQAGVVRDTPIAQYVLYQVRRDGSAPGQLLGAVLGAVENDGELKRERRRAVERSRSHTSQRLALVES